MRMTNNRNLILWTRKISFMFCIGQAIGLAVIRKSADMWLQSGGQATIYCRFDEAVTPCSWNRNGFEMDIRNLEPHYQLFPNDTTSLVNFCKLAISNISLYLDNGTWQCVLPRSKEFKGIVSDPINLIVLVTPSIPIISGGLELVANDSDEMKLNCTTSYGHPATNITWQLGNFLFVGNSSSSPDRHNSMTQKTTSELRVAVTRQLQNVHIFCLAQHGQQLLNTSAAFNVLYDTTYVNLSESSAEIIVDIGKEYHVNCEADGNPSPTFEWICKGQKELIWRNVSNTATLLVTLHDKQLNHCMCLVYGNKVHRQSRELIIRAKDISSSEKLLPVIAATACSVVLLLIGATLFFIYRRRRLNQTEISIPEGPISLQDRPLPQVNDGYLTPRNFKAVPSPPSESYYVTADNMASQNPSLRFRHQTDNEQPIYENADEIYSIYESQT